MEAHRRRVKGKSQFTFAFSIFPVFGFLWAHMLTFHTAGEEDIPALRTLATRIWRESYGYKLNGYVIYLLSLLSASADSKGLR